MKEIKKGKGKVVKTKVRNQEIILPGQTWMWQSNRVTELGMYINDDTTNKLVYADLNIYHIKILATIMYKLQDAIHAYRAEKDWKQLDIFRVTEGENKNVVEISFLLSDIASKQNYKQVEYALDYLRRVDMKMKSPFKGEDYVYHTGYIDGFDLPRSGNTSRVAYIYLKRELAEEIIRMRTLTEGGGEFTRYLYEVIMNCTNKYSWRIYQYISMWKSAGGVRVSYEKFRNLLGIEEHEYKRFADFKKKVLMAVQHDLYDATDIKNKKYKADSWFNCGSPDFVERKGKAVSFLNFKVITPELKSDYEEIYESQVVKSCILMFGFGKKHIEALDKIFVELYEPKLIMDKIYNIFNYIEKNKADGTGEELNDVAAYALKSLLNEFSIKKTLGVN